MIFSDKGTMKTIIKVFIGLLVLASQAFASELTTKNYTITIETHCEEGVVSCGDVTYVGTHNKTGKSITLKGATWNSMCADGVTPNRFIGYRFKNGDISYLVYEEGLLEVYRGDELLLSEEGTWVY
ncbi:hypothetical protein MSL71_18110 [Desulfoluna butyratoxydans]|uniref:Uncharacterized protein n=2 Tax=Desulfoluna butyratoxydans TaxID=231438 RepID=A0A4U8YKX2_9BACT|nr:hypothetical protein MSL71_18110 [Desulfoluna butyratoxydans]